MTTEEAAAMIRTSFAALVASGLIPKDGGQDKLRLDDSVVIFGSESPLDSISFVTLISDVEERLNIKTGNDLATDIMSSLSEMDGFSIDNPHLTVRGLAEFMVQLSSPHGAAA